MPENAHVERPRPPHPCRVFTRGNRAHPRPRLRGAALASARRPRHRRFPSGVPSERQNCHSRFPAHPLLPCLGPAFDPTPAEIEAALQTHKSSALDIKESSAPDIMGYYCSRPRRPIEFSAKDQALFFELSPGANRLFLLVRPSATEDSRGALFYRNPAAISSEASNTP